MKEFPEILEVKNKENFSEIFYNRTLMYLRKAIYEHIISHDQNDYFDLEKFFKSKGYTKSDNEIMIKTICKELQDFGWKCKQSFGGTALFIYSTEKPPPSCWDDGL